MKKKRAAAAAPPVPTIEPTATTEPIPPPPAPPPRVLLAPDPTPIPVHVRRDATGRIVEFERRPLVVRPGDAHAAAAQAAQPAPRTMTELAEIRRTRLNDIGLVIEAKRQFVRVESSRVAGPIIAERDKKVQEARALLDTQRSRLRKEEEETIARITREARAKFKQLGDEIQAAYERGKEQAHADARAALVAGAEEPLAAKLATIETEAEAARAEVIAWCTSQEGAIREAEKAAAAAAGATLGAFAPAPAASAPATP